ncbi:MAG TPA: lytic transglycosylase domain-containing protein [Thermoanaerobaculia bacterium]|nr:lytic transglycosylase domain-containing protein [Thermoanaerobaculia bacterium]
MRERLRAASAALAREDGSAASLVADLDASPLGLSGLPPWIVLASGLAPKTTNVSALLSFAAAEPGEPYARLALGVAARLASTPEERASVRGALLARPEPPPSRPRALVARALAEARVTAGEAGRQRLVALAAVFPDAPSRAADLFDDADREAFDAAVKTAPADVRVKRARVLVARDPKAATALLRSLGSSPPAAALPAAAEAWLAAGSPRDAKRLLARLSAPPGEAAALHLSALSWLVETSLMSSPESSPGRRARRTRAGRPAKSPAPVSEKAKAAASEHLARLDALLARPIPDEDRRRLLDSGIRLAFRTSHADDARRLLTPLVSLDPSTEAGASEWFAEAWTRYTGGDFAGAARLLDEQITAYRTVFLKRRAMYWAARAHERGGDAGTAKALYAGLVSGTVPDLYARWAAAALGVTLPAVAPAVVSQEAGDAAGVAGIPSRELLRCGFPGLAEDAAESEGSLDPLFSGRAASARGDHRRAAAILKRRYPELGTPEEGAVPTEARSAYYPLAEADRIAEAARAAGVPASLLFGLIRQESVFSENAKSRSGALGLMQVMPSTGRLLFRKENGKGRPDLSDPAANLRLGARYLRQLLDVFAGDTAAALAAYNAGPGRVRAWKKASGFAPEDEFLESIPFGETRLYVKRVLFYQGSYASLYGLPLDNAPSVAALPVSEPSP